MDSNLHRFYWNDADFFIIELKIDENELTLPYKYFYMKKSGSQSKKTKKGKKRTFRLVAVNLLAMLAVVVIIPVDRKSTRRTPVTT